jgi:DNA-binding NarL/FixJ family response regulator
MPRDAPFAISRLRARFGLRSAPVIPLVPLTPREIEVVRLLARGHLSQEVERRLQLGPGVMRGLIQSILEKMQVHTRAEAILRARDLGLLE